MEALGLRFELRNSAACEVELLASFLDSATRGVSFSLEQVLNSIPGLHTSPGMG